MGKGSKRRPVLVANKVVEQRWEKVFGQRGKVKGLKALAAEEKLRAPPKGSDQDPDQAQ